MRTAASNTEPSISEFMQRAQAEGFEVTRNRVMAHSEPQADGTQVEVKDHYENIERPGARTWRERVALPSTTVRTESESETVNLKSQAKTVSGLVGDMRKMIVAITTQEPHKTDTMLRYMFTGLTRTHDDLRALGLVRTVDSTPVDVAAFDAMTVDERIDRTTQLFFQRLRDALEAALTYYEIDVAQYSLPTHAAFAADPSAAWEAIGTHMPAICRLLGAHELPRAKVKSGRQIIGQASFNVGPRCKDTQTCTEHYPQTRIERLFREPSPELSSTSEAWFADYDVRIDIIESDVADSANPRLLYCVPLLGRTYEASGTTLDHLAGTPITFRERGPMAFKRLENAHFERDDTAQPHRSLPQRLVGWVRRHCRITVGTPSETWE